MKYVCRYCNSKCIFFLIIFKVILIKDIKFIDYLFGVGNVVWFCFYDLSSKNEIDSSFYYYGFIISIRRVGVYNLFFYYIYVV